MYYFYKYEVDYSKAELKVSVKKIEEENFKYLALHAGAYLERLKSEFIIADNGTLTKKYWFSFPKVIIQIFELSGQRLDIFNEEGYLAACLDIREDHSIKHENGKILSPSFHLPTEVPSTELYHDTLCNYLTGEKSDYAQYLPNGDFILSNGTRLRTSDIRKKCEKVAIDPEIYDSDDYGVEDDYSRDLTDPSISALGSDSTLLNCEE